MELIYDIFTYNGEWEVAQIHFGQLYEHVDKFIVVEAKTTFTGLPKPLYFAQHERFFERWWPKIEYFIIDEDYSPQEIQLSETSPNTIGAAHWKNEFLQKESIHKALIKYKVEDNDTVYIGDADEIWEPYEPTHPAKLKLLVYAYYLNNLSNEEFWGTLVAKYGDIKNHCLNHLRSNKNIGTHEYYGWHFTSMGGTVEVRRKLNASYTAESYNTPHVQQALDTRVTEGLDYLGRNFTFTLNESDWPNYLRNNRYKYLKLCKSTSQK